MINNLNPETRKLIPDLMGGVVATPAPPGPQELRPAWVSTNVQSTYVVPGDWPDDQEHWFPGDAPTYPWRQANNVEYLIDGKATYEAMVEAMETANAPGHFIVIIGWTLHIDDFVLSDSAHRCPGACKTLLDVLKGRVAAGVTLRVLLYPNPLDLLAVHHAKAQLDALSAVPPVLCVIDQSYRPLGSHHQKIVLVYGTEGLIGFLGGVDFNPDRVRNVRMAGFDVHGPLHDVHMRVMGDAARDLMVLAVYRWNFAVPWSPLANAMTDILSTLGVATLLSGTPNGPTSGQELEDMAPLLEHTEGSPPANAPHHIVKLGQTVGNPLLPPDHGVWSIVKNAINEAKRFIYMEEQYLWSLRAVELLANAAARVQHITILLPPDDALPNRQAIARARFAALRHMKACAGEDARKIRIYVIGEDVHQYVHAKIFVIDDELAIIGSANCNDRGYAYDSEVNAAIADQPWQSPSGMRGGSWWRPELNLARKLRIQLWAEHLNRRAEELVDGVAAEVHWRSRTGEPRIVDYRVGAVLWHEATYEDTVKVPSPRFPEGISVDAVPWGLDDWIMDPQGLSY